MNFTLGSPDTPSHLPDSSPTTNCSGGDEDSDDHMAVRRGGDGSSSSTGAVIEREHMFDKVVTPSDVGKLNRLVIPKQHAEKYFPLDSSTNDKGLLLNFEDRNGKPWRFRYSYWNSSQSYVMTKGWSRFVKEKKLDAGDVVSFQRGIGDSGKDRLFIDWRRRPNAPELPHQFSLHHRSTHPWNNNPIFLHPSPTPRDYSQFLHPNGVVSTHPHPYHPYAYNTVVNGNPFQPPSAGSIMYLRTGPGAAGPGAVGFGPQHAQGGSGGMVFESVPVVQGKAAAKRLRLFGVNMDCPISDSDQCHILSSSTTSLPQYTTSTILPALHPLDSSSSHPIIPSNHKGKSPVSLDLDI